MVITVQGVSIIAARVSVVIMCRVAGDNGVSSGNTDSAAGIADITVQQSAT